MRGVSEDDYGEEERAGLSRVSNLFAQQDDGFARMANLRAATNKLPLRPEGVVDG